MYQDACSICANKGWIIAENDTYGLQIERCDNCFMIRTDDEARTLPEAQQELVRISILESQAVWKSVRG
jgi:hypothetical protein